MAGGCGPFQTNIDQPAVESFIDPLPTEADFARGYVDKFIPEHLNWLAFKYFCRIIEQVLFSICPKHTHGCLVNIQNFDEGYTLGYHFRVRNKILLEVRYAVSSQSIQLLFDG